MFVVAAAIPTYHGDITQPELLKRWPTRSPEVKAMVPPRRHAAGLGPAAAGLTRPGLLGPPPYCVTGPGAARVGPASAGACTCATFSVMDTRL